MGSANSQVRKNSVFPSSLSGNSSGNSLQFDYHIGIDYSGAATSQSRSRAIQIYESTRGNDPQAVATPASSGSRNRNWNRAEVADWLLTRLSGSQACIIGVDHGFSFPISYFLRHQLVTWDQFLRDFAKHWPTDQAGATVEEFRSTSIRTGDSTEFRLTENWTSSAKSVFQFDVNGSVAKSTHAGLPYLLKLRKELKEQVHFWPFDGWSVPDRKSVIAETYPSLFRNRYPREGRTGDQQDAYAVSRWLTDMDKLDSLGRFLNPPLSPDQLKQAEIEGWILGV
jgi:hypothetical protein